MKARVASGEYASVSEVICEGLRVLLARNQAIEQWVLTDVASAYDKIRADPSTALTLDQVRASLAAARSRRGHAPDK